MEQMWINIEGKTEAFGEKLLRKIPLALTWYRTGLLRKKSGNLL